MGMWEKRSDGRLRKLKLSRGTKEENGHIQRRFKEMITAFYSDPHFGHEKIIELCSRNFDTVDEMNLHLIYRYNQVVPPDGIVVWLGDCFFTPVEKACDIMDRLNGRKILVRGGHDGTISKMLRIGFDAVVDEMTTMIAGRVCTLNHFPFIGTEHNKGADNRFEERRPKRKRGQLLIHGHVHTRWKRRNNMIHVGVDAWAYAPAMYLDVRKLIEADQPVRGGEEER